MNERKGSLLSDLRLAILRMVEVEVEVMLNKG
jgi:hypothetical protein